MFLFKFRMCVRIHILTHWFCCCLFCFFPCVAESVFWMSRSSQQLGFVNVSLMRLLPKNLKKVLDLNQRTHRILKFNMEPQGRGVVILKPIIFWVSMWIFVRLKLPAKKTISHQLAPKHGRWDLWILGFGLINFFHPKFTPLCNSNPKSNIGTILPLEFPIFLPLATPLPLPTPASHSSYLRHFALTGHESFCGFHQRRQNHQSLWSWGAYSQPPLMGWWCGVADAGCWDV